MECTNPTINQTPPRYLILLISNNTKDLPKIKPSSTNKNMKINILKTCTFKPNNTNTKFNTHKTQRVRIKQTITHKYATTNKQSIQHGHKNKPMLALKPININLHSITTINPKPTTQQRNSKKKKKTPPNP